MAGNAWAATTAITRFITTAAGDAKGPVVLGSYPEQGATGVPVNAIVQVLFDRPIFADSARRGGIILETRGQTVNTIPQTVGPNGGLVTLTGVSLLPNTDYRIRITNQLTDANGFATDQQAVIDFTTGATPTPEATAAVVYSPVYPSPAPVNTRIAVRSPRPLPSYAPLLFSSIGPSRGGANDLTGNFAASATLSANQRTLVIAPADPLPARSLW